MDLRDSKPRYIIAWVDKLSRKELCNIDKLAVSNPPAAKVSIHSPFAQDHLLPIARTSKVSLEMAYSRNNNSTAAEFTDSLVPFASGSFKYVWQGHYTDGPRKGQKCVAKAFKTGSVFEDHFFELEMAVIEETRKIVNAWNNARIVDLPIKLSKPQIWTDVNGQKFLIEPFIENFQKFNSNSGYVTLQGDTWSDALQALSHFSYYNSRGQMLLCDIQGGIYQDGL